MTPVEYLEQDYDEVMRLYTGSYSKDLEHFRAAPPHRSLSAGLMFSFKHDNTEYELLYYRPVYDPDYEDEPVSGPHP